MNPSHLSDPNQQWWDPDAGFENSTNAGTSWYPNQVSAPEFESYGRIPHDQHGYSHHEAVHSFEDSQHGRSHRSRKRPDQNLDLRERDFKVNSYRPVFSVPPENVSRTSKDGSYEFAESCHAFRARPDSPSGEMLQDVTGRHNIKRKDTSRRALHYTQEAEFGDKYGPEAHRPSEFAFDKSNQDATLIFYCPHIDCGYAGPDKNSLRKHLSIHGARKFSCEKCTADFHTARDLRRHQEAKHPISNARKIFICKVPRCNRDETRPFTRKDNARQHVIQVHEVENDRAEDFIKEIMGASPEKPTFRAHRPTGSSSTDDTIYSNLSHDSNASYNSFEDPEGEDIIAEFTYLQEYDSDLDVGYPSSQDWQQDSFCAWASEHEQQMKPFDLSPQFQGRRRSKPEIQSRSASHLDRQAPLYQRREGMVQDEACQSYNHTERSSRYVNQSHIRPISQIKEESPDPRQRYRFPSNAATAIEKPAKQFPNSGGKTYHPETSVTTESLEAAFEKVLVL
ncbi:hypothetical protein TWF506_000232 [Arthrobotrys conoides]|uniref:C2H2-type domain-containing protein n=1 Tax=Arthrobotrys conoides TaxID=74498 RepID=A0AAN8NFD3_9PEZI